jgi:septal ring factor EnvC (AmiA/AmiB activator)
MDLENSGMEQTASEMPTQLGGGATSAGAGDAEVSRLVRELERRMAQMETRLDETTEARERLERQVAAQAEELRVQRAAIARTQRALRSLNRPAEEQATEPAIREPSA